MLDRPDLSQLLPDEVWEKVFSFYTPRDLCSTVALVNQRLRNISDSEPLWRQITGGKTKSEYCLPFIQSNSPQACLTELRRGNILGFLNSRGYFDTRYGYLNLPAEDIQLLLMHEFSKTDLNIEDLKILFDFEQLLAEMKKQNDTLAVMDYSSKIHFLLSNFITILVFQKNHPDVLKEISAIKVRGLSDCQKLDALFCDHKLNREQIKSLKLEANLPQSDGIEEYRKSESHQAFLAEHMKRTAQRILAYELTLKEEDKAVLVDMLSVKASTKDNQPWYKRGVAGFIGMSSKEKKEQALREKIALHHLRNLCSYAKGICKNKQDIENADLLRKIENTLIENIENIDMRKKNPLSQTEIEKFRTTVVNVLSEKVEISLADHVKRLAIFPLHSKEFETKFEIIMDKSYQISKRL